MELAILINAGEDATEDFVAIHSTKATKMLDKFYVGDLDPASLMEEESIEERIDPKTIHVSVAWMGISSQITPLNDCAYGFMPEENRRVVTREVKIK